MEKLRALSYARISDRYTLEQKRSNVDMAVHRFLSRQPGRAPRDLGSLLTALDERINHSPGGTVRVPSDREAFVPKTFAERSRERLAARAPELDQKLDSLRKRMSQKLLEARSSVAQLGMDQPLDAEHALQQQQQQQQQQQGSARGDMRRAASAFITRGGAAESPAAHGQSTASLRRAPTSGTALSTKGLAASPKVGASPAAAVGSPALGGAAAAAADDAAAAAASRPLSAGPQYYESTRFTGKPSHLEGFLIV
jgi:hypothetical protein